MSYVIQHRTGKWFIGRPDNRSEGLYRLTPHAEDAAEFDTEADAERVRQDLDSFQNAYALVHRHEETSDAFRESWHGNPS